MFKSKQSIDSIIQKLIHPYIYIDREYFSEKQAIHLEMQITNAIDNASTNLLLALKEELYTDEDLEKDIGIR